jgi:hypothetical protein
MAVGLVTYPIILKAAGAVITFAAGAAASAAASAAVKSVVSAVGFKIIEKISSSRLMSPSRLSLTDKEREIDCRLGAPDKFLKLDAAIAKAKAQATAAPFYECLTFAAPDRVGEKVSHETCVKMQEADAQALRVCYLEALESRHVGKDLTTYSCKAAIEERRALNKPLDPFDKYVHRGDIKAVSESASFTCKKAIEPASQNIRNWQQRPDSRWLQMKTAFLESLNQYFNAVKGERFAPILPDIDKDGL